jgi:hypothetical protein
MRVRCSVISDNTDTDSFWSVVMISLNTNPRQIVSTQTPIWEINGTHSYTEITCVYMCIIQKSFMFAGFDACLVVITEA